MNKSRAFFSNKAVGHSLFWLVMLIYYISSSWPHESDKFFLFERMFSKTIFQLILAYVLLYVLIPHFLDRKRRIQFAVYSILAIYVAYVIHTAIRCFYLVPKYPEVYSYRPPLDFIERITNGFAFLGNITSLVFPAIILIVIDYYRKQKEIISLQEQKRATELNLLKHQLNPHFLFNTLNNLYTLALKKSDKTPEVIEKLSEILDYILYRCEAKYVPVSNEIKLIENYIALEKVRYGQRVEVDFAHEVDQNTTIAPLLLLTLVENAFKHGVSQEVGKAFIRIRLNANQQTIQFDIENSKPAMASETNERSAIGLSNIEKQLKLLYPDNYKLQIDQSEKSFKLHLKLKNDGL